MAKDKKKGRRIIRSLESLTNFFGDPTHPPEPMETKMKPVKASSLKTEESKPEPSKPKVETLSGIKRRVQAIFERHIKEKPPESRMVSSRDVKTWILNNPTYNINSQEFINWFRSPDGEQPNQMIIHFGKLLAELGIEHQMNVEVKGYIYDYFIPQMSLYVDIDPVSLDTDDPKAKISITIDKNKIDVVDIWRKINETRDGRCKPFRFMAIKERLYDQGVKEFLDEYIDWYYQRIAESEKGGK